MQYRLTENSSIVQNIIFDVAKYSFLLKKKGNLNLLISKATKKNLLNFDVVPDFLLVDTMDEKFNGSFSASLNFSSTKYVKVLYEACMVITKVNESWISLVLKDSQ
jgi:hypothetical protein